MLSVMKRLATLLLLLPAVASAGTSDPGGIASAILWLILIAFGVWIGVSIFIGRGLTESKPLRIVLAVSIFSLPLAYCGLTNRQFDDGLEDLAAENQALVSIANDYLARRCDEDRVQRTIGPVEPSGGVLVSVASEQRLNLAGTPLPAAETPRMRENQKRYGQSYPAEINDVQYKSPIHWVRLVSSASVLMASPFDFVEAIDRSYSGRPLQATARKGWWLGPGKQAIAPFSKQDLETRIANLPDERNNLNHWLSQPVTSSTARYVFSVADISTLEDRRHWVARSHLQLVDKESGQTAAEYVGFAANIAPAYRPGTFFPWEMAAVCPGKEREYQLDRMPWNLTGFFFREVVSYKSALPQ